MPIHRNNILLLFVEQVQDLQRHLVVLGGVLGPLLVGYLVAQKYSNFNDIYYFLYIRFNRCFYRYFLGKETKKKELV